MNGELSVGMKVKLRTYSLELLVVNGQNSMLVIYGGDMSTCGVPLSDQTPVAVMLVSTFPSN